MKLSEILSSEQWNKVKWVAVVIFILSLIGFTDATYLTFKHFTGEGVVCSLVSGCDEVLTSDYATLGNTNIPLSILGSFYYLLIFILSVALIDTRRTIFLKATTLLTLLGTLFSLILIYIQAFVIEAFCLYCLLSAATSLLILIFGYSGLRMVRKI